MPFLLLLIGVSLYFTIRLRALQFRYLPYALKLSLFGDSSVKKEGDGDISHFQSLMTALAASIGIGNIVGVATAVAIGGFGALFWMWVMALLGMATKFAEAVLAVKYRELDENGEMCGGPMYYIRNGLRWHKFAGIFAIFGAIGAFGGGNMIQAHSVAHILQEQLGISVWLSGGIMVFLAAVTLLGGIQSISRVASLLVPFMALVYIAGGLLVIFANFTAIPTAFFMIFKAAFSGQAATGGFAGASVMLALQVGLARGLMSSESGLGSSPIAAAAAKTDLPGRQALVSMSGGFLATCIMCTITGLVLALSGVVGQTGAEGELLNGAPLTVAAFQTVIPGAHWLVTGGLIFFAFTTILGYAYYGEKCVEYLFGVRVIPFYRLLFIGMILPGAVLRLDLVWRIADITNGLMAIPNLLALIPLCGVVVKESHILEETLKKEAKQEQMRKEPLPG
ncbi:MAG: sodium:alanine symporter family protein [Waddliaceae bacterium]|nr:sodium:alanine symporter family protein [Waddliaceae bacterium]